MSDEMQVYLNGAMVPASEAKISVFDAGFLHGASTFTTMMARNGVVFRLEQHLTRLAETVTFLGLQTTATREQLTRAVDDLLEANSLKDARMRITLTPGVISGEAPTTLVTADPLPEYPSAWYEKGILVIVTVLRQPTELLWAGYKTGGYLPRFMARREAAAKGAEDALWFTADGQLAEGCFSNVFLVKEGKVCTPPRGTPVLPGVVRDALLELCGNQGIDVECEQPLTVKDLFAAEEVFMTSSCMGIRPVVQIEKHQVGEGTPGKVTRKIRAAYEKLWQQECKR